MSLSQKQIEELENFFSQRPRDPGAPPVSGLPYENVVDNAPSTGGGEFSVQDLLTLLEYEDSGQLPETGPPPVEKQKLGSHLLPAGGFPAPEGPQQGPPAPEAPAQIGPPIDLGSDEPIGSVAQRPEQEQKTPAELLQTLEGQSQEQTPMPGAQFAATSVGGSEEDALMQQLSGGAQQQAPPEEQVLMQQLGTSEQAGGQVGGGQTEEELLMSQLSGEDPGTGPVPLESEDHYANIDTGLLQGTLDRQRNEAERLTGNEAPQNDKEPGTLMKIVDVLSRPNFAMAEGTSRALEEDREGGGFLDQAKGFASGLKEGFTGKEKTTFADVLDESGVENKWAKGLGGFALDVALDPTTYVGGSVLKGASKTAVEGAGVVAARKAAFDPDTAVEAARRVDSKVSTEVLENLKHGKKDKSATAVTDQARESLIEKETRSIIHDQATKAEDLAKQAGKGAVGLTIGGKKIGQSEKLYEGISRAFKPLREMDSVQAINKMFRPTAELGDAHSFYRLHENISTANFEDSLKYWREQTGHLSKEQAKMVSHVMEGTRYSDDAEINRVAQLARKKMDQWFDSEVELGIVSKDMYRPNYVRHVYDKGKDVVDDYKGKTPDRKRGEPGFAKEREYPTLEQAKKDKMKPEEDIREIIADRAAKHYREISHHSFMNDLVDNFGIREGTKQFDKANGVLKGMGTHLEKITLPGLKDEVPKSAYVPREIKQAVDHLTTIKGDDLAAKTIVRHYDKIHQELKFHMTVSNPGHHVRNLYGNLFQAYQDGLKNPARLGDALKVVRASSANSSSKAFQEGLEKKIKIGDGYSDLHEVMDLYKLSGLKSGYMDTEMIRTGTNKAKDIIRNVSTQREDAARLAHMIDILKKEKPKNWSSMSKTDKVQFAYDKAAHRVQKFQFDYGDLTQIEKQYARRIAMFYTFMRKNTALQLEMTALRPGKIVNPTKANTAVEQMLGAELSPQFEDRIPEWVREMNIPLIQGDGEGQNPEYAGLNLPTSDLNRIGGPQHMAKEVISSLSSPLKVGVESAFEKQAFSGAPLPDGPQYVTQQLPVSNLLRKMYEGHIKEDGDITGEQANKDLVSWLSGISRQEITPQRQQSELRRQQQPVQEIIRNARSENSDKFQQKIEEARGRKK